MVVVVVVCVCVWVGQGKCMLAVGKIARPGLCGLLPAALRPAVAALAEYRPVAPPAAPPPPPPCRAHPGRHLPGAAGLLQVSPGRGRGTGKCPGQPDDDSTAVQPPAPDAAGACWQKPRAGQAGPLGALPLPLLIAGHTVGCIPCKK
jgi:hypothetical protein